MHDRRATMLKSLADIGDLPHLPSVVFRLEQAARDPDAGVRDLASIIETDPPMAARLLKLANSVFYMRGNFPVTTIPQAIVRLGLKEVRRLCLTIGATQLFVRDSERIDHVVFWHHCLTVACVTKAVARAARGVAIDPEQAYIAGLLHEVGSLVLDQFFDRLYGAVFRVSQHGRNAIHEVEKEYLGIDHGEIGGWLLQRWKIPPSLACAVRFHHEPSEAPEEYRNLCHVVHVADFVSSTNGLAGPGEEERYVVNAIAWADLGLDMSSLPELAQELTAEAERSRTFLALTAA